MEELIKRLETEKSELTEKTVKIQEFLDSNKFDKVDPTQQSLLKCQFATMMAYGEILRQRIKLLKSN